MEQRDELLPRLVDCARPGGWVLFEEGDRFSLDLVASPALRKVIAIFGAPWKWARTLPSRMTEMGLEDVCVDAFVEAFRGGSRNAEFWIRSIDLSRDRLLATGHVTGTEVDDALVQLGDPSLWHTPVTMFAVWARRPG